MNAYTFVANPNNGNNQHQQQNQSSKISSSILHRLQQLKKSMRPQSLSQEQQYQSTNTNKNLSLNLSQIQNYKLNKYLPSNNQQQQPTQQPNPLTTNNEQFESYRKSLQKKLNNLFEKQKQIMKTQSTYSYQHPSIKNNQQQQQNYFQYQQGNNQHHQLLLQNKYQKFKNQTFVTIPRQTKSFSTFNNHFVNHHHLLYGNQSQKEPQIIINRDHKSFSTIQQFSNLDRSRHFRQRKDQEIQQMQRKIKMLEIKYLNNTNPQHSQYPQHQKQERSLCVKKQSNIDKVINPRQYRSKSTKSKNKKLGTSPDNIKTKNKNSNKQTIQSNYLIENNQHNQSNKHIHNKKSPQSFQHQKSKQKQRIREYMKTIDNKFQEQEQQLNDKQRMLHQQFKSLKQQFQTLLDINKSIIEKVQMNEDERTRKKQSKLRAKVMLKEILFRLQEIRYQIKNQPQNQQKNFLEQLKFQQNIKSNSMKKHIFNDTKLNSKKNVVIFQKSSYPKVPKETTQNEDKINKTKEKKISSTEFSPNKKLKLNEKNQEDVEKLKLLLDLQIQHRNIVQKKLQIINAQKSSSIF